VERSADWLAQAEENLALSWPLPAIFSSRPRPESLRRFLDALAREGENVAAAVVYGSMARGDYKAHRDWDVLVVLRRDPGVPVLDRFLAYAGLSPDGWVQVFPYTVAELEDMFASFHLTVLDALEEGVVVYEDGTWRGLHQRFLELRGTGTLRRLHTGRTWQIGAPH
jgi:hypothetical protein